MDSVRNSWPEYPTPITNIGRSLWHCSWCFPSTVHFFRKSTAYSHHDRFDHEKQNEEWWCKHVNEQVKKAGAADPLSTHVVAPQEWSPMQVRGCTQQGW